MTLPRPRLRPLLLTLLGGVVLAVVWIGAAQERLTALGQSTNQPRITSLSTSSISANSARIDAAFSEDVESRIIYGKTTQYDQALPPSPAFFGAAATQGFGLTGLEPGTTYHYRVEIRRPGETRVVQSADRTFTTKSGTAGSGTVVITEIVADCTDTQCRISYTTNLATNVQLRWDTQSHGTIDEYQLGGVGELSGQYLAVNRGLLVGGLNANTTYHYRLRATTQSSGETTTGDLTFRTSANADDHIFTTGGCSDGTAIGQCSATTPGAYCEPGGNLIQRCGNQCGFNCPSGQTCNASNQCVVDPALSSSPFQCNRADCYESSGAFKAAAPSGCYSSWPKCAANTILKVRKDRSCNLWLTCATSVRIEPQAGQAAENLCLSLAACNSLNQNGNCNKYLPLGQCDNNPLRFCAADTDCEAGGSCNNPNPREPTRALQNLTFSTPGQVPQIANLSGNVLAGLDWAEQGGANIIQGFLPWQLMRQVGGNATISNSDFESSATEPAPWIVVPTEVPNQFRSSIAVEFEEKDVSPNRVLTVSPISTAQNLNGMGKCDTDTQLLCSSNADCTVNGDPGVCSVPVGQCTNGSGTVVSCTRNSPASTCASTSPCRYPDISISFAGTASEKFLANPGEYYYAEVRVRAKPGTGKSPLLRVQLGHGDYTRFTAGGVNTYVDVRATDAWQRVGLGPLTGLGGLTRLAVVCADTTSCSGADFQIDNAQVKPVLQVNTDPRYITPSCRLYPKEDSPSCEYKDSNGINYRGWRGYCLENDSVTGTCLSWWPVDIIKGEAGVFGTDQQAGYKDQNPLYFCAESAGNALSRNDFSSDPYSVAMNYGYSNSALWSSSDWTIGVYQNDDSWSDGNVSFFPAARPEDQGLRTGEIAQVDFQVACGGHCLDWPPARFMVDGAGRLIEGTQSHTGLEMRYREQINTGRFAGNGVSGGGTVGTNRIIWAFEPANGCPTGASRIANCVALYLVFNANGEFLYYGIHGNDESGEDTEATAYRTIFRLREACEKVVEVVQPGGINSAFAARVNSSAFTVPDIGTVRTTDLAPYGAIVPPAGESENPSNWPLISAQKQNLTQLAPPGQARSGHPYACNGNCSRMVCTVDPSNACATAATIRTCQNKDVNDDGIGDGQCTGVATSNPLFDLQGAQEFSPTVPPSAIPTGVPQCTAPVTQACTATSSVSMWTSGSPLLSPESVATSRFNNTCRNTIACNGRIAGCTTGTSVNYAGVRDVVCTPTFGAYRCTGTCFVNDGTTYQSVTQMTDKKYYAQQFLRRLFAQSYGIWQWTAGRYEKIPSSDLAANPDGSPQAGFVGWLPPTEICQNGDNGQPARPSFPQDYCAVPPSIVDDPSTDQDGVLFLSGPSRTATISGGSGTIGIKFNTAADPEQQPLGEIRIDWGDTIDTFAYPFAPRSDVSKPHIFSHVYVINPNNPNCRAQGTRTVCEYPIRIQVSDNWGWCNDANRNGDQNVPDTTPDTKCHPDPSGWIDTGLRVTVEP